jgi:two-component system capsular synthesis sensor histidine kinase RcsC
MNYTRVLCVDDNASFVALLKIGLESHGFKVVTAKHGLDALKQFKKHAGEFDAIVTDYEMPELNGLELVRSLRKQEFNGRIVVMSGNLKPSDVKAFSVQGVSAFVHKPFEMDRLVTLILDN